MSPDDALRLAEKVGGLFPEATPQQVEFLADQFAPFEREVAEETLTSFRRQFEALNVANLLRRVAEAQQRRAGPRAVAAEREAFEAQRRREESRLEGLSDAELEWRKAAVLERNPDLRKFLGDKSPRESLVLRALILREGLGVGEGNGR